ncbi:MAG: type II toxin-antitoxin system Phd/YefM family antitoxin [Cyanobacteriota bacterium]
MPSRASSAHGGQGLISAQVAKAQLSALLDRVEGGEHIVITRRNRAIAELKPVQPPLPSGPRPLGQACDAGTPIPASFFEPLPDDLREAFEGRGA